MSAITINLSAVGIVLMTLFAIWMLARQYSQLRKPFAGKVKHLTTFGSTNLGMSIGYIGMMAIVKSQASLYFWIAWAMFLVGQVAIWFAIYTYKTS